MNGIANTLAHPLCRAIGGKTVGPRQKKFRVIIRRDRRPFNSTTNNPKATDGFTPSPTT
jgi:hypothetical protein